ncbi:hemoblobin-interacting domain-containing protein [Anaerotignum sp.]|uniref:hemoblobin-interacting domain-containing protein n=1 Tax=Anaerotignum sp. TaxID=2039241 RepID=UPI00289E13DE|nr:hypothetical protein [Anaerotignum sp.]
MKKYIAILLATSFCITSNVDAFAATLEVFGTTKMNLWDVYLTENAKEKPDAISTATIDAVAHATYSIYDNKPVEIDTAVDLGLIADAKILNYNGINNDMVNRIISTWEDGYCIPLLGQGFDSYETNELTRNVVRYTDAKGKAYDFSYDDIANANPITEDFTWEKFAKVNSEQSATKAPHSAKYLLNNGNFGKRALVDVTSGINPPQLTIDDEYSNNAAVKGKFIKLDFENNAEWANAVYAIKVNETGLIYGDLDTSFGYNDAAGDTTFLNGSKKADKSKILIRLNQKFRLGKNKLTFMAKGYQDAEYTYTLTESLIDYPWLLEFKAVNETKQDAPLENSTIMQGDVIRINVSGGDYFNKFDRIYIDGKLLPYESASNSSYLSYYKYGDGGKTLWVYTSNLSQGLHEIRLAKQRYNDLEYFFTVSTEGMKQLPTLTLLDKNGEPATQNFSVKGSPIVLKGSNLNDLKEWYGKIRDVLYSGPNNEINDITDAILDETNQTITLNASSMQYWNKGGEHSLLIRSSGYPEFKISLKRGNVLPESSAVTYRAEDGYVIISSDYSYISAENLNAVVINGVEYSPSLFEMKTSYGAPSTLTIPSEYFEADTQATVKVLSNGYMDFSATLSIPKEHSKRKESPQIQAEVTKVIVNGTIDSILKLCEEEQDWKDKISKVTMKKTSETIGSGTVISLNKITKTESGKLTISLASSGLRAGTYLVYIDATGYTTATFTVEIGDAVPGETTYELNADGSVTMTVGGNSSTYVKNIAVKVDGQDVASSAITKGTNAFTISKDSFSEKRAYQVLLSSTGYMDKTIEVQTNVLDTPELQLKGVVDTSTKKMIVTFADDEGWQKAISGVEFVRNNGSGIGATLEETDTQGEISINLGTMYAADKYILKIAATGYRNAFLEVNVLNAIPSGTTYELLLNGAEQETKISFGSSSYANAITEIIIGEKVFKKNEDFTISSNVATLKDALSEGASEVKIISTNYPDQIIQIENLSIPSESISLPEVISSKTDFIITSNDDAWLNAIRSITIGSTNFTSGKLTKDSGKITIGVNELKYLYGTGKSVKITADGYRSIMFTNVTIYDKLASDYSRETKWTEQGLEVNLNETGNSSYYSIKKVFVDGIEVEAEKIIAPSYSNNYTLVIKPEVFNPLNGQRVSIKITSYSAYTQDIDLTIDVALETEENSQGLVGQSLISNESPMEDINGSLENTQNEEINEETNEETNKETNNEMKDESQNVLKKDMEESSENSDDTEKVLEEPVEAEQHTEKEIEDTLEDVQ